MNALEWAAVAVTLAAVWLTVREDILCWPVSLVAVSLYAVVFYQARLYANMWLQAVFAALSVYGWYHWRRRGPEGAPVAVARVGPRAAALLLGLGAAGALLLGHLFRSATDAAVPYLDSALTSFSIVAQWMLSRKILENWLVWIVVDVAYVLMFVSQRLHASALLYAVFIGLATQGYLSWKRSAPPVAAA